MSRLGIEAILQTPPQTPRGGLAPYFFGGAEQLAGGSQPAPAVLTPWLLRGRVRLLVSVSVGTCVRR